MRYGIEDLGTKKIFGDLSFGILTINELIMIAENGVVITSTIVICPWILILLVDVWLFEYDSNMYVEDLAFVRV